MEPLTSLPISTDAAIPTDTPQITEIPTTQPAGESAQGATVSFTNDVFPIIQSRCINCHGGDRTEDDPVVTRGDAVNSLQAEMVSILKMPKRGPKLTPPQVQVIVDWINQDALDNQEFRYGIILPS